MIEAIHFEIVDVVEAQRGNNIIASVARTRLSRLDEAELNG
jgi:hypothetical protein